VAQILHRVRSRRVLAVSEFLLLFFHLFRAVRTHYRICFVHDVVETRARLERFQVVASSLRGPLNESFLLLGTEPAVFIMIVGVHLDHLQLLPVFSVGLMETRIVDWKK